MRAGRRADEEQSHRAAAVHSQAEDEADKLVDPAGDCNQAGAGRQVAVPAGLVDGKLDCRLAVVLGCWLDTAVVSVDCC